MERIAHGLQEIAFIAITDQVGEHLGIGFREEMMAIVFEPRAQGTVVFDDAVVDERDVAGLVEVRVGVRLRRRAVGGPAGVGDASARPLEKLRVPIGARPFIEVRDFSDSSRNVQDLAVQQGKPRRVVTAVLQLSQPADQDGCRVRFSNVSYDSAHDVILRYLMSFRTISPGNVNIPAPIFLPG